jgi:hypothetical protein
MVKEELNSEEKFFEKAVITEKFIKKYKKLIISVVVGVVVIAGANMAYEIHKQNNIDAVNEALSVLQNDSKNSDALLKIKSISPELYDVWRYSKAVADEDVLTLKELKNSKAIMISDLSSYEEAQNKQDVKALDKYALKQGAVYKDLALVQSAIVLMSEKKIEEAHAKLGMISDTSSLSKVANALMHYGVK